MKSYQNMLLDSYSFLGIQSYSHMMSGVSNHLLSTIFRFHDHSQKVIGCLRFHLLRFCYVFFLMGSLDPKDALQQAAASSLVESLGFKTPEPLFGTCCRRVISWRDKLNISPTSLYSRPILRFWWWANTFFFTGERWAWTLATRGYIFYVFTYVSLFLDFYV